MRQNHLRRLVIVLAVGALGTLVWLAYENKADIHWPDFTMKKPAGPQVATETVSCRVVSNLGKNKLLRFDMLIPCEDKKQKKEINKQMPQVKNDLLVYLDRDEMEQWVKDRDFTSIKRELLRIVNQHSKRPVKAIYFDKFIY